MGFNLLDPQGSSWVTYVIMGVIVLLIVGLFVWQSYSNKKKQKEAMDMMNNLKIGDKITIYTNGEVLETYPMQFAEIQKMEYKDVDGCITTVIPDWQRGELYEKDY